MILLLVAAKELARGYRLWLGSLVVIIASAAVCAATLAQFDTAEMLPAAHGDSLRSMSSGIFAFSMLAAIAITSATTNLAVASGRRGYALLQLAGFLPRQLTILVFAQLFMLALLGTGIGIGVGRLIAQPLLDLAVAQTSVPEGASVTYGGNAIAWAFGIIATVVMLAGVRAAVRAGKVPPIEALREPEPPRIRMGVARWIAVGALGALALGLGFGVSGSSPGLESPSGSTATIGVGMLFSIALTALAASMGPLLYPVVLRSWTALVPVGLSGAWFLARRSCQYRITQSTAAVTPLMVGIALPGALYTIFLTAGSALAPGGSDPGAINSASIFTILGPALLLAALGSAAIIFMTGRTRARDNALVAVGGGTRGTAILSAAFEAVIYVITALLIAGAIFGLVGLAVAAAFRHTLPSATPAYGIATALGISAVGAIIIGIATVLPVLLPTNRSLPSLLAAE
ncbi:FtsX-like permease family protein [Microbacterium sp.]|uniref:FtsX-like permease family protein n=1 Tax=Microbacterium sp. TaxID=51671 RepID=UPI003A93638D